MHLDICHDCQMFANLSQVRSGSKAVESVLPEDLRLSLDDFIYSKKVSAPPTTKDMLQKLFEQQATASTSATPLAQYFKSPPQQMATASSANSSPFASTSASTSTSNPAPPVSASRAASAPQRPTTAARTNLSLPARVDSARPSSSPRRKGDGSFGKLSLEFLKGVQTSLETLGYDLIKDPDVMQKIVSNRNLSEDLFQLMSNVMPGVQPEELRNMISKWGVAVNEQLVLETNAKTKKTRPIWRCAVCGRIGCPVAPYIDGSEEFED